MVKYFRESEDDRKEYRKILNALDGSRHELRFFIRFPSGKRHPYVVVPGLIRETHNDYELVEPVKKEVRPNIENEIKKSLEEQGIAAGEKTSVVFWDAEELIP